MNYMEKKTYFNFLADSGILKENEIKKIMDLRRLSKEAEFEDILVELGFLSETELAYELSSYLDTSFITDLEPFVNLELSKLLGLERLKRYCVLPLMLFNNNLYLAMRNPLNKKVISKLEDEVGLKIKTVISTKEEITRSIDYISELIQRQGIKLNNSEKRQNRINSVTQS